MLSQVIELNHLSTLTPTSKLVTKDEILLIAQNQKALAKGGICYLILGGERLPADCTPRIVDIE